MIFTGKYDSPLGLITLAGEGEALTGLWFEGQKYYAQGLKSDWKEKELPVFKDARRWLDTYTLAARRLPSRRPFPRRAALSGRPYGKYCCAYPTAAR